MYRNKKFHVKEVFNPSQTPHFQQQLIIIAGEKSRNAFFLLPGRKKSFLFYF